MKFTLFAGVNGAGKSSLYTTMSDKDKAALGERINVDEIVATMGNWQDKSIQFAAGKIAAKRIKECLNLGISFNQETTLAGLSVLSDIKKAKVRGFRVDMFYVYVDSVEIAKQRIRIRVAKGGHGIPDEDVDRRFSASLSNLKKAIDLCDNVTVFDNTVSLKPVTFFANGILVEGKESLPSFK